MIAYVNYKLLSELARKPSRMSAYASGFDLHAALDRPTILFGRETLLVPTGLALEIPPGYEGQVRPRSGLALKYGVTVLNAPGTIDSDYRGEVSVLLVNHSDRGFEIKPGDRIAQLVIVELPIVSLAKADELDYTDRGADGFGSTGV